MFAMGIILSLFLKYPVIKIPNALISKQLVVSFRLLYATDYETLKKPEYNSYILLLFEES